MIISKTIDLAINNQDDLKGFVAFGLKSVYII